MFYSNYSWGMNIVWWFIWIILLLWFFALPFYITSQRKRKENLLDKLQKQFSAGELTNEAYLEKRLILEGDNNLE